MFQKNSLLIQKCTHFIWQEKYFCLQREEGHSGTYTSQVRNGFRQNYSSSVNFSPSLKARHSCTILSFLVRPASHNVSLESSKLNPLLWQTPCANQGQFWWFWSFGLIFFFTSEENICNLQALSSELHWMPLGVFHPRSENFLPCVPCWWPELLWGIREIKTALKWFF